VHSALGIAVATPATSRRAKWLRGLLARTRELARMDKAASASYASYRSDSIYIYIQS
jgi:hypothetical protein